MHKSWILPVCGFGLMIAGMTTQAYLCAAVANTQSAAAGAVRELLQIRLEESREHSVIRVANEPLCSREDLLQVYDRRSYQPAWSNGTEPLPPAYSLTQSIRGAYREGLNPADYHLGAIEKMLDAVRHQQSATSSLTPIEFVDLDLLLTDAFLVLGKDLSSGRVQPEGRLANWPCNNSEIDFAAVLESAMKSNSVETSLKALLPQKAGYNKLREVLGLYRDIAANGGWGKVPNGPKLANGDRGARVKALRERLLASGDRVSSVGLIRDLFDVDLEQALQKFQQRHGLADDGVLGASTLSALNVPVEDRIEQIKVNMERWRWLTRDLESRYILVNIANFELYIVENDIPIAKMRAVVGKRYRPTPIFASRMTYIVINPSWHVPPSIAVKEMLPQLQKDPEYLRRENIKVFEGWQSEQKELNPDAMDWRSIKPAHFKFHFRQEPGPQNPLGRLKFMFPNKFDVYVHDTPARHLFKATSREFSHGCIRIERPLDLAEYLLRGDSAWTHDQILAAIDKGVERTVPLPHPIPVYILYATAWVDRSGSLQLRRDTYGLDAPVSKALLSAMALP